MNSDQFTRSMQAIQILLVVVAVLLLMDMASFFQPPRVAAAPVAIQYKMVTLPFGVMGGQAEVTKVMAHDEAALNELGHQGWEVVTVLGEFVILKK
jgi:Domain of unknown function (DUF4177)